MIEPAFWRIHITKLYWNDTQAIERRWRSILLDTWTTYQTRGQNFEGSFIKKKTDQKNYWIYFSVNLPRQGGIVFVMFRRCCFQNMAIRPHRNHVLLKLRTLSYVLTFRWPSWRFNGGTRDTWDPVETTRVETTHNVDCPIHRCTLHFKVQIDCRCCVVDDGTSKGYI
jgi:hypothetical protein